MKKITKNFRRLLIIIFLTLITVCILAYNYGLYTKTFSQILILIVIINTFLACYFLTSLYSIAKKTINSYLDKEKKITIKQVIEQKNTHNNEEVEHNEETYNKLIEELKCVSSAEELANLFLSKMAHEFEIVQGIFYQYNFETQIFNPIGEYAYYGEEPPKSFKIGEGINGQVARDKSMLYLNDLPVNYRKIVSGLGRSEPKCMIIMPVISKNETVAIVEISLIKQFNERMLEILQKILNEVAECLRQV